MRHVRPGAEAAAAVTALPDPRATEAEQRRLPYG
jgi:hypothetical protein